MEVEYTVAMDGTTRDMTVLEASPEGVFEDATLAAIGAWQYEARIVAGQPVDQRVRLRVVYHPGGD